MIRKLAAVAATAAVLVLAAPAPAEALQPGWERGTVPTILGYPKCIATKSAVRIYGVPKTAPGEVCAVRVWATYHRGNRTDYERANRAVDGWELVGLVDSGDGRRVADLVRRPVAG